MTKKDYYEILGVSKDSSKDEIKKMYKKLALQHHPDRGGDAEKFKEISEAYAVLSDDNKRKQYDQFGHQGFDQRFSQEDIFRNANFEDIFSEIFGSGGDNFFDMFFGGGRGRRREQRGSDLHYEIEIEFEEAAFGTEKEIQITKNSACDRCGGVGAEPGTSMKTCDACAGSGVWERVQQTILGSIKTRTACESCHGQGEIPNTKCSTCNGSGIEYKKKSLRVEIPSGVESGMKIRVRGQGEAITGGSAGDLYVVLYVKTDPRFERIGENIYTHHKIGFTQAALGDEIEVETLDGRVKLKVPAGTQSGDKLRLRGKGVPRARARGDMIVVIQIVTPRKVSRKEKKLFEELNLIE